MTAGERYVPGSEAAGVRREKTLARELRQTGWWKRRISDGRCHYCRRTVGTRSLTLDHVVPLIRGGRSVRGNVVPACKECNTAKKAMLPWEWEVYLQRVSPSESE